jgi:hypothetical protein
MGVRTQLAYVAELSSGFVHAHDDSPEKPLLKDSFEELMDQLRKSVFGTVSVTIWPRAAFGARACFLDLELTVL